MSPMRRLFEGSAYLKGSYHKDKTSWLYNLIYFMGIFFFFFVICLFFILQQTRYNT